MGNDDDWAAEAAKDEADRRRKAEPAPALSAAEFLAWRSPRMGDANPTRFDSPLWPWLARTRWSAYQANELLNGPSANNLGAMWCFDRFGMSETLLPDGRMLFIGGEHEDFYDPDFFIYNDVTLMRGDEVLGLYGYPRSVFPPTDFHTATLVGDKVYIVGRLGYPEERVIGETPVFCLSLPGLEIERVDTQGEGPGWIHRHAARLSDDGRAILVTEGEVWRGEDFTLQENIDTWVLDLASRQWSRQAAPECQRWTMVRKDRKSNRLWDTRQELWNRKHEGAGFKSYWPSDDPPDFDALRVLYRLDDDAPAPAKGPEYNEFSIVLDGATVRFVEQSHCVRASVEGRLSEERLIALQRHTLRTLELIDRSAWEIEEAPPARA
jgi:hypothetical protein